MTTNYKPPEPVAYRDAKGYLYNQTTHPEKNEGLHPESVVLAAYEAGKMYWSNELENMFIVIDRTNEKLAAAQADNERLREALDDQLNDCINFDGGKLTNCIMEASTKALATPTPHDHLREHDARLVEKLSDELGISLDDYADKIRKGKF